MLKNSNAMARGVRDLATVTRAAEHMRVDLEASVTAVSSWTALMPELIKLSVSDPQSSLALLTATERMLEEVRAVPSSAPDNDDADAFGPDADAADEAQITAAVARIAAGELTTIPYEVVERLADGKHRVRAWREHRGMTQAELAKRATPLLHQLLFERVWREELHTGLRNQHLLLELHPLGTAFGADVAFDADRHIGLEGAVVAQPVRVIVDVTEMRIFVGHADTMGNDGIAIAPISVGDAPCLLRQLAEAKPGSQ
jgi:hypothetical protein